MTVDIIQNILATVINLKYREMISERFLINQYQLTHCNFSMHLCLCLSSRVKMTPLDINNLLKVYVSVLYFKLSGSVSTAVKLQMFQEGMLVKSLFSTNFGVRTPICFVVVVVSGGGALIRVSVECVLV